MTRSIIPLLTVVLASCILLATAVPVKSNRRGLKSVATAHEDGTNSTKQPAIVAEYRDYAPEQPDEEEGHGSGDDEKQYYGERSSGPDYYHQQDEENYPKVEAKHLCLQESKRERGDTKKSEFRCCTPADRPDSCVEPSYPENGGVRGVLEPDFISNLVGNPPASCTWKTGGGCPSWTETCFAMEVNCTVTAAAGECGCPYKAGFKFQARGFAAKFNANSCEQEYVPPGEDNRRGLLAANYAPANGTFYTGSGWIFRGKIHLIATNAGYKEAKGNVEFVTDFLDGVAVNITRHPYGEDGYHGREEERYYGGEEERYHGRDDERHYDRDDEHKHDDEHKYGRDDEPGREDKPKYGGENEPKYDREDEPKYGREDEPKYGREDEPKYDREDEQQYTREDERDDHEREGQYGERRYSGPYEAKVQGFGFGPYDPPSGNDRPWLKAGNMKITLYETEYN